MHIISLVIHVLFLFCSGLDRLPIVVYQLFSWKLEASVHLKIHDGTIPFTSIHLSNVVMIILGHLNKARSTYPVLDGTFSLGL